MAKFVMEIEVEGESPIGASMAFIRAVAQWEGVRDALGVMEEMTYKAFGQECKGTFVVNLSK